MPVVIKKTRNEIDKYGLLNKTLIDSNIPTTVFSIDRNAVSADVELNILSLSINQTSVNIWILPIDKELPEDVDLIENNLIFSQNSVYVRTGIVVGEYEKIVISTSSPSLVVRVTGSIDLTP